MSESNYPAGVTNRTIDEHFGSDDREAPEGPKCECCNGTGWIESKGLPMRECRACGGTGISNEVLDDGDDE